MNEICECGHNHYDHDNSGFCIAWFYEEDEKDEEVCGCLNCRCNNCLQRDFDKFCDEEGE